MAENDNPKAQAFSPRNFLRARRPERFSDSIASSRPILDQSTLEYHLSTITGHNQESVFEEFVRHLLEKTVCPNLMTHTGPTGGGDSKVDSETYPVAAAIAETWYVGVDTRGSNEPWAFAISASKEWAQKIRRDMASIAGTNRGYTKAFYVSNQLIPDKKRAAEETALKKKHGFEVKIFDLTWIVKTVFSGKHEELAIKSLQLAVPLINEVRKGPLDTQRERDLEAVEERIRSAAQTRHGQFAQVGDALEAALLARNLELPRTETDGRFLRAQRLALANGTVHHKVRAFYEHAWTSFWWYEDFTEFLRLYQEVEQLALSSQNIADLELLHNLWNLLVAQRDVDQNLAKRDERTGSLRHALERLRDGTTAKAVSLQARSLLCTIDLALRMSGSPDEPLHELRRIVAEAKHFIGFPLRQLSDLITELSEYFDESEAFERLFDDLVNLIREREGELAGARLLLKRGAEQLDANRPYDAIRILGRAFIDLYKNESREEIIMALGLCASAYERVGLLWAARGTLLNAAAIANVEWWTHSDVTLAHWRAYRQLKWVALQVGHLPELLAWHELEIITRGLLVAEGYSEDRLASTERDFDAIAGMLLLRADLWQLKQLEPLPDVLIRLGFQSAVLALQFALGFTEDIKFGDDVIDEEHQRQIFLQLMGLPASKELPSTLELHSSQTVRYRSVVLGCLIELTTDNRLNCVQLSQSLLAAVEALLAASVVDGIVARTPTVNIRVRHSDFAEFPFSVSVTEPDGIPSVELRCSEFAPNALTREQQATLKENIFGVIAQLIARAFFVQGADTLSRVFGDDGGLSRTEFVSPFVTLANSLGANPKLSIADWAAETSKRYELTRVEEWDAEARRDAVAAARTANVRPLELPRSSAHPPADGPDLTNLKHSDISFESLIRDGLWNKARWKGISWLVFEDGPPLMVLGFTNGDAASAILANLIKDIGIEDPSNRLRVTIIRGISRRNPTHYRVVIGSNADPTQLKKLAMMGARVHMMEPLSTAYRDRFLKAYEERGQFLLGVAVIDPDNPRPVPPMGDCILKSHLIVRDAWNVGLNDPDMVGVHPDDDVIIPEEHQADAPFLAYRDWALSKSSTRMARFRPRKSKVAGRQRSKITRASRKRNRK
jgi:hypothetical protein